MGIVSLGELDTYRDMDFGQSKDEVFKKPKEALEDKNLEKMTMAWIVFARIALPAKKEEVAYLQ